MKPGIVSQPTTPPASAPAPHHRAAPANTGIGIIVRLHLAIPLLLWLATTVQQLVRYQQTANSDYWKYMEGLRQADMFLLQVNIGVAVLGLAVLALWSWQPQIAHILLAVFAAAVVFMLCAFWNVLSHSAI